MSFSQRYEQMLLQRGGMWKEITNCMRLHIVCLLMLFLTGCCSMPANKAITAFQQKHPAEFRKYVYLKPANLDTYSVLFGDRHGTIVRIGTELENKFGNVPGMNEYVNQFLHEEAKERQDTIKRYTDFQDKSANGGVICQFEWNDGKMKEIGLLALKDGEIVKREVWMGDFLTEK
jgi:hypothetical protein